MNASGTTPQTDADIVYYVIGRHSEASPSPQRFPFIYSVLIMGKKEADTCSLIEETVRELQDRERSVSLSNAARGVVYSGSCHKTGFPLLNRLYDRLNELYKRNPDEMLYIRAAKPHKVGDVISMTDAIEVIGLRPHVKQKHV
jgi:hypothetical protein